MSSLATKHCTPCREGTPPLSQQESSTLAAQLDGWSLGAGSDAKRLTKTWRFKDFASALAFVNRVGAIADAEDHHPDIALGWGRASVELWTHTAGGLTENDFIVAARIDDAFRAASGTTA